MKHQFNWRSKRCKFYVQIVGDETWALPWLTDCILRYAMRSTWSINTWQPTNIFDDQKTKTFFNISKCFCRYNRKSKIIVWYDDKSLRRIDMTTTPHIRKNTRASNFFHFPNINFVYKQDQLQVHEQVPSWPQPNYRIAQRFPPLCGRPHQNLTNEK